MFLDFSPVKGEIYFQGLPMSLQIDEQRHVACFCKISVTKSGEDWQWHVEFFSDFGNIIGEKIFGIYSQALRYGLASTNPADLPEIQRTLDIVKSLVPIP